MCYVNNIFDQYLENRDNKTSISSAQFTNPGTQKHVTKSGKGIQKTST